MGVMHASWTTVMMYLTWHTNMARWQIYILFTSATWHTSFITRHALYTSEKQEKITWINIVMDVKKLNYLQTHRDTCNWSLPCSVHTHSPYLSHSSHTRNILVSPLALSIFPLPPHSSDGGTQPTVPGKLHKLPRRTLWLHLRVPSEWDSAGGQIQKQENWSSHHLGEDRRAAGQWLLHPR